MHNTVLLQPTVEWLGVKQGDVILDATVGSGGHSREIAKQFGGSVLIIGIDTDQAAIDRADKILKASGARYALVRENFRNLDKVLELQGQKKINRAIFDIGVSSDQIDDSGRGFTFKKDEPLLMTMKQDLTQEDLTAREIVNTWEEENIATILKGYGEERFSKRIARAIVEAREIKPIETTTELVSVIENAVPSVYKRGRIHFATRTFQALRIAVNDELRALSEGIQKAFDALMPGGRLAVITFHSLEDRIAKRFIQEKVKEGHGLKIAKKPVIPTEEEVRENRRSRSAKLRIVEKI